MPNHRDRARRFQFDGELLTVFEIQARVPALSIETVRRRLRLGQDSTEKMLAWVPPKAKPTRAQNFVVNPMRRLRAHREAA